MADIDLLVVQKHTIDGFDGSLGSLGGLVVDEAVALGAALLVGGDLAREDVTEGSERVVQSLVVDGLVQVLDEDVALTGLAEGRVTLRPHDAAVIPIHDQQPLQRIYEEARTYQARPLIRE